MNFIDKILTLKGIIGIIYVEKGPFWQNYFEIRNIHFINFFNDKRFIEEISKLKVTLFVKFKWK